MATLPSSHLHILRKWETVIEFFYPTQPMAEVQPDHLTTFFLSSALKIADIFSHMHIQERKVIPFPFLFSFFLPEATKNVLALRFNRQSTYVPKPLWAIRTNIPVAVFCPHQELWSPLLCITCFWKAITSPELSAVHLHWLVSGAVHGWLKYGRHHPHGPLLSLFH